MAKVAHSTVGELSQGSEPVPSRRRDGYWVEDAPYQLMPWISQAGMTRAG